MEAIGGTVTIAYGFTNAVVAILAVAVLIFASCIPISFYAARDGVDIDLLTRGAGFGYIGSTVTSLIYAAFTFIFFAIEAVILASTLTDCLGIPPALGYLLCSLAIVPLVTHGITFISRVQLWSQPAWVLLQILPFAAIALGTSGAFGDWTHYPGSAPGADGRFNPLHCAAAASVVLALVAQIGEQVDYLRFLPGAPDGADGLALVDGDAGRGSRLDRNRRVQVVGWIVSGEPCHRQRGHPGACCPSGGNVSRRLWLRNPLAGRRAGAVGGGSSWCHR